MDSLWKFGAGERIRTRLVVNMDYEVSDVPYPSLLGGSSVATLVK